eukprot:m.155079 g.155079  ORF g.155079 m.155079 type:complete len:306 (+) comp23546_c0_seq3:77-994(+)
MSSFSSVEARTLEAPAGKAAMHEDFKMLWLSSVLAVVVAGSAVGNDVNPMPSPEVDSEGPAPPQPPQPAKPSALMHWSVTPSIVAGDPDATLTLSGTNIGDVPINVTRARFSFYGEASSSLKPYATSLVADCRTFTMHGNFYNWTASNDGCGVYFSPNRPSDLFVTTAPIVSSLFFQAPSGPGTAVIHMSWIETRVDGSDPATFETQLYVAKSAVVPFGIKQFEAASTVVEPSTPIEVVYTTTGTGGSCVFFHNGRLSTQSVTMPRGSLMVSHEDFKDGASLVLTMQCQSQGTHTTRQITLFKSV